MLLYSSLSAVPWMQTQFCKLKAPKKFLLHPRLNFVSCNCSSNDKPFARRMNLRNPLLNRPLQTTLRSRARNYCSGVVRGESAESFEWSDGELEEMEDELGLPWEGAVVHRRNASISHIEYCTTLERLGLWRISTSLSKSRASELGLRVTNMVKDYPDGTPVLISIDVTRKKKKELRLDGIIRSVISLRCNRCGEPAAKSIFSNFSLLLSEEPIEEPETIDMGLSFGEEKSKTFVNNEQEEENGDFLDFDDQLYFPPVDKEIDISKPIRDLLHVEITIDTICDPKCKGICLRCGVNLNNTSCNCKMQSASKKQHGPFGNLRKQAYKS